MEPVKQNKTRYLVAKIFISSFMLFSAYFSYTHPQDLARLGYPDYFRIELVAAKIAGAIILLLPLTPARVKDWIYTGFLIAMISALIAHICSGDPITKIIFVSVDLVLVLVSICYVAQQDLLYNKQTLKK